MPDTEVPSVDVRRIGVADGQAGERLDRFLAQALPDLSRSRLQQLIAKGGITREGRTIGDANTRVKPRSPRRRPLRRWARIFRSPSSTRTPISS